MLLGFCKERVIVVSVGECVGCFAEKLLLIAKLVSDENPRKGASNRLDPYSQPRFPSISSDCRFCLSSSVAIL